MPGWRLKSKDGTRELSDLSLQRVRQLLADGTFADDDLIASPTQSRMLPIHTFPPLRRYLPKTPAAPQPPAATTPRPPIPGATAIPLTQPPEPRRRHPRLATPELEISPMIDVVFQLLIFFMVCSVIQKQQIVEIPTALTGTGVDPQAALIVELQPDPQTPQRATLFLDNQPHPNLTVQQAAKLTARTLDQANLPRVVLKADRQTPFAFVRDYLAALKQRTDAEVLTGVRDKR